MSDPTEHPELWPSGPHDDSADPTLERIMANGASRRRRAVGGVASAAAALALLGGVAAGGGLTAGGTDDVAVIGAPGSSDDESAPGDDESGRVGITSASTTDTDGAVDPRPSGSSTSAPSTSASQTSAPSTTASAGSTSVPDASATTLAGWPPPTTAWPSAPPPTSLSPGPPPPPTTAGPDSPDGSAPTTVELGSVGRVTVEFLGPPGPYIQGQEVDLNFIVSSPLADPTDCLRIAFGNGDDWTSDDCEREPCDGEIQPGRLDTETFEIPYTWTGAGTFGLGVSVQDDPGGLGCPGLGSMVLYENIAVRPANPVTRPVEIRLEYGPVPDNDLTGDPVVGETVVASRSIGGAPIASGVTDVDGNVVLELPNERLWLSLGDQIPWPNDPYCFYSLGQWLPSDEARFEHSLRSLCA